MRRATIYRGDARAVLANLPTASVHCVVTSPPYWGLRDYGIEPLIWGGDPDCEHAWGDRLRRHRGGPQGGSGALSGRSVVEAQGATKDVESGSCTLCGAWRGSLGLEPTPELFVEHLVEVFEEVRRVLRPDGTLWLNMGDSYASDAGASVRGTNCGKNTAAAEVRQSNRSAPAGLKPKDMVGIPWRVAFALQAAGWWLRSEVIWNKRNPMPESVTDRPTKAHEQVFLLAKNERYFYDAEAVREQAVWPGQARSAATPVQSAVPGAAPHRGLRKVGQLEGGHGTRGNDGNGMRMAEKYNNPSGRNLRSVWSIATAPFAEAHFATFPSDLAGRCILAGTSERGCCGTCGAPLRRQLKKPGGAFHSHESDLEIGQSQEGSRRKRQYLENLNKPRITTGWLPTCECEVAYSAPAVPCTVLDPFGGAGTTAMVTLRLGRTAISIELKPEYVEMQERRIRSDAPLLNAVEVR